MPVCRTVGGEPYGQPGSCKAGRGPDPVSYVVKIEAPAVDVHRSAMRFGQTGPGYEGPDL